MRHRLIFEHKDFIAKYVETDFKLQIHENRY